MTTHFHSTGDEPTVVHGNIDVYLPGIQRTMQEAIYTAGPEIFTRELAQNGQDGMTARSLIEPGFKGKMFIELTSDAAGRPVMICEDNGIGVTMEECRSAFGTLGYTTKRPEAGSPGSSLMIGWHGIGFYSVFNVTDEVTVDSKRAGSDALPVRWVGNANGTFTMSKSSGRTEAGTRISFRLRDDAAREFTAERIFEIARKYGRYLKHPIGFRSGGSIRVVNDELPLWEQEIEANALLAEGRKVFGEDMLSTFHFQSGEAGANGVAFVKASACHSSSEAAHVVFVRRMLVSERALDIEPPGTPFLAVLMNADHLSPNAGRDALMANDPRLPALRKDIEAALLAHLNHLHHSDPGLLKAIVSAQYRCLAHLAEHNQAYLPLLIDHLPMETTLGEQTLGEVLRRHSRTVEYVTDGTDYQRLQAKARSEGDCIVRVETDPAHRLINLVSKASGGTKAQRITSSEYLGRFAHKSAAPTLREQQLLGELSLELSREGCEGVFCEADDDDHIARLDMGTMESLDRLLHSAPGDGALAKKLLLNRLHPVVSQMIHGAADSQLLRVWIRLIYHIALLEAREAPTTAETRRFSRAFGNIFASSTFNAL